MCTTKLNLQNLVWAGMVLLITTLHPLCGQSKRHLEDAEAEAKSQFENYHYHLALPGYQELNKAYPNEISYKYFLAYCYIHVDNDKKALPLFEECLKYASLFPHSLYYYAGRTYHLSERYDDAINCFSVYLQKISTNKKKNAGLIADVTREMAMCETGKSLISKPLDVKITNLGAPINSEFAEYAPIISGDETTLMFTSSRPTTTGGQTDEADGDYFEDIYMSFKNDSGFTIPENVGPSVNSIGHDATIALSADGQKLLFYRYSSEHEQNSISGDLFLSELYGTKWTPGAHLSSKINSEGWEPSASFSADDKMMYFASDRPGGFGGTDIYSIKRLPHGEWEAPQNLGAIINTPYDEDSPYLHPDGKTLYFSSNGHRTMGGYDLFTCTKGEAFNQWSDPENFGYPINTPYDDVHFSWSPDGTRVYFSSIRPEGLGDRDIYFADIKRMQAEVMVIKGLVLDSSTAGPVDSKIFLKEVATNEVTETFKSNSATGKYLVLLCEGKNYVMTVEADHYQPYTEEIEIANMHSFQEEIKHIYLKPIK